MSKFALLLCFLSTGVFAVSGIVAKRTTQVLLYAKGNQSQVKTYPRAFADLAHKQAARTNDLHYYKMDEYVNKQLAAKAAITKDVFDVRDFSDLKASFNHNVFADIKDNDAFVTDILLTNSHLDIKTTVYQSGKFFDGIESTLFTPGQILIRTTTNNQFILTAYNGEMFVEGVISFSRTGRAGMQITHLKGNPQSYGSSGKFIGSQSMNLGKLKTSYGARYQYQNGKIVNNSGDEVTNPQKLQRIIQKMLTPQ